MSSIRRTRQAHLIAPLDAGIPLPAGSLLGAQATLFPSAIASAEAFGALSLATSVTLSLAGIDSTETFGSASLLSDALLVTAIASTEAFGTPTFSSTVSISIVGIDSAESFGTAFARPPADGTVRTNLLAEYLLVDIGSGSTVVDSTGNGNTLTLGTSGSTVLTAIATSQVAPTWQSDGLLFDNTTNTIATMADGSVVSESTTNFSAELWVKPITPVRESSYFNFGWDDQFLEDTTDTSRFWPVFYTEWYLTGGSVGNSSVNITTLDGHGFALNAWYQVVVTREPSTGKLTTYINGAHQNDNWTFGGTGAFDTNGMAFPTSAPNSLQLLRSIGNDGFHGVSALFGEIRFYGSVLSSADVRQNYNARALAVTGLPPVAPLKPSGGLSGGMKPLMNGGMNG